jgi:uncharacterized membrane protein
MTELLFIVALTAGTVLTGLVAGLLFAFAVVTMPGIGTLGDREFIRAFQVMDAIIQDNHPLFMGAWLGSRAPADHLCGTGISSNPVGPLDPPSLWATAVYVAGVEIPTVVINVPLNNALQRLDTGNAPIETVIAARRDFEARWNRWNRRRTVVAIAVTATLVVLVGLIV